jgi:DNA topoisomerase-1
MALHSQAPLLFMIVHTINFCGPRAPTSRRLTASLEIIMCAKLLIVESPGKVKKIQGFLGSDWKVAASVGHVRDLPVKEIGVAPPDFVLQYVPTDRGKEVLAKLAALVKKADGVILATDPDREGEAIAWHLADALKLKGFQRVTYSEITEKAVRAALAAPRSLDMALVKAQEARRALDRLCGYMISGPLSSSAGTKLSAGRVQSPALRLVVEREREIREFRSVTHYGAELAFEQVDNITDGWKILLMFLHVRIRHNSLYFQGSFRIVKQCMAEEVH